MSVELSLINVTVRRDSMRRVGVEEKYLAEMSDSSVDTHDAELMNFAHMSKASASLFIEDLKAQGLQEGIDIADASSTWIATRASWVGSQVHHHRRAWLVGTDPKSLVEMQWMKVKRDQIPGARPWEDADTSAS